MLEVEETDTGRSWRVQRRYNQFRELHSKLLEGLEATGETLGVALPPKKIFGRFQAEFIRHRAGQLQEYLDALVATGHPTILKQLASFLDPKQDVCVHFHSI